MLYLSDIPCELHGSWSCQEGRDNHLCAPVLPPKQNVSKIGSVEVPIAFETCLEMLVRVREMALEMATCYCTYLVCRPIPPRDKPARQAGWQIKQPRVVSVLVPAWSPCLQDCPGAQQWPWGFCTPQRHRPFTSVLFTLQNSTAAPEGFAAPSMVPSTRLPHSPGPGARWLHVPPSPILGLFRGV